MIFVFIFEHLPILKQFSSCRVFETYPELKTFEWDILNPDRIINLEIKNERRTSNI